ncbi:MAG: PilZ domain-containing protein [Candidatus Eremiobacteraeota bacterium]|nr:PilZ domain-containing protein [Candidatus Eremiobacteraeota bacterium]
MSDGTPSTANNGEAPYRRRYVRVAADFPVTWMREGSEESKDGISSDLGGGGVRLSTDEDLPLGAVLILRFNVPGTQREMLAKGRIVLSFYNAEEQKFFHGISFTHIDPRDQEEIVRYVAAEVQRLALEGEAAAD